ncbi:hypothetical protein GLU64_02935 [Nanohaloarchaea archaeon]|nr:hypothetical protein [Candidatus Nanohaloarchaea archaeon]
MTWKSPFSVLLWMRFALNGRDGSDLGLYVGQRADDVLISYSVDGETGETLQVEEEQIGDLVEETYTNAVFGSKM